MAMLPPLGWNDYRQSVFGLLGAQQSQSALSGLSGGLAGVDGLRNVYGSVTINENGCLLPKTKTFREELQHEIDKWLA